MPAYKVFITSAAERDIDDCVRFISRDNPGAAGKRLDDVLDRIAFLEKTPVRAPRIPESAAVGDDYRHLVLGNHRIVFRVKGKMAFIARVIHSALLLDLGERPE